MPPLESYIAFDLNTIPQETKDNLPHYKYMVFSSDSKYLLMTGYNEDGSFSHTDEMINYCVQWSPQEERQSILDNIFANAIVYKKEEFERLRKDSTSIWYQPEIEDGDL